MQYMHRPKGTNLSLKSFQLLMFGANVSIKRVYSVYNVITTIVRAVKNRSVFWLVVGKLRISDFELHTRY